MTAELDPVAPDPGFPTADHGTGPDLGALLHAAIGDVRGFGDLYEATSSHVYGAVLAVVDDPDRATEVTIAAYREIWRTCARFEPGPGLATVLAWMVGVAHRAAVDAARRGEPWRADVEVPAHDLLDRVTPDQRDALGLAWFGGRTHHEIGLLRGVEAPTVAIRIRDGLIHLRDELGLG